MTEELDTRALTYTVGAVAIHGSRLELVASTVYFTLLGGNPAAECVAFGQSWSTVSASCKAILASVEQTPAVSGLRQAWVGANAAYAERNAIVHGYWASQLTSADGVLTQFSVNFKRNKTRSVRAWTVGQLEAVVDQLEVAVSELAELLSQLLEERNA